MVRTLNVIMQAWLDTLSVAFGPARETPSTAVAKDGYMRCMSGWTFTFNTQSGRYEIYTRQGIALFVSVNHNDMFSDRSFRAGDYAAANAFLADLYNPEKMNWQKEDKVVDPAMLPKVKWPEVK
jgi:hypothetical protein